jgi:hypothetical protein
MFRKIIYVSLLMLALLSACAGPASTPVVVLPSATAPIPSGFQDQPALPNNSGIEGVVTAPDRAEYHRHVHVIQPPVGDLPPMFGEHYPIWQNCGIYDQPLDLGNALHSMEHGAVWLTYAPNLDSAQVTDLQKLVRGHAYVLMSPYPPQTKPVVLTAWGTQLVIDSLPDDRIAKFITYYEQGPQDPERGAPCSGAIGNPLP